MHNDLTGQADYILFHRGDRGVRREEYTFFAAAK